MKRLALAAALALGLSAPAGAWLGPQEKSGDLDGDGSPETVKSVRIHLTGVKDPHFDATAVNVDDTCNGSPVSKRIAGPQDNLALLRLRDADARPGREVFVDMRSGASAHLGEARVVAWRAGSPCSRARQLFAYKTDHHTRTPPGGNGDIGSFDAGFRRRRGSQALDVVLTERFLRRGEPLCCGSIRKTTVWRYSASLDRYFRLRTELHYDKPRRGG